VLLTPEVIEVNAAVLQPEKNNVLYLFQDSSTINALLTSQII
jgi:hypothetical protein